MNRGFDCKPHYKPLVSSWQDCKEAAEYLGYAGDQVAHVDHTNGAWDGSRPRGCFLSDNGRVHFNEGAGGNAIGNDHILCIRQGQGKYIRNTDVKLRSLYVLHKSISYLINL